MVKAVKQLISYSLPVAVLIIVPCLIERDLVVNNTFAFIAGILVILGGLIILIVSVYTLSTIGKGTLAPWFPTGKLVVAGLYKYVRNPMITGVLITLLGESIALQSFVIMTWMLMFFLISHLFFLVYEEPNLEKRFGKEYLDYKKRIPRWIPDFRNPKSKPKN
jgi:protein-S-isoprenylcysteine O-methyltransferase Ste14